MKWIIAALVCVAFAGCVDDADPVHVPPALEVYPFTYPGSSTFVEDGGDPSQGGAVHGVLWQLRNNGTTALNVTATVSGATGSLFVGVVPWTGTLRLEAGASVAVIGRFESYNGSSASITFAAGDERLVSAWSIERLPAQQRVAAGHEVHTLTVGVWENGTSFYTNIPELLSDPAFPAGERIDRDEALASARPLPVYVFDEARSEQPGGSKDRCFFTTIDGYNALLKTQTLHSTGARYLAPDEAYTRPGAQDHPLYGDALIFLNTIVAHHGAVGPTEMTPDPTQPCFDAENHVPGLPVV